MAASTSDLIKKTGASTVTTLAAPGKATSATSITVGSTTNYPTDTGIVIAIRVVDSAGELVAGTYTEWSATVTSGTTLAIEAVPVYGSDQVYAAGSTTQVYIPLSSYAHNKFVDGFIAEHSQLDGTHTAVTADSIVSSGAITGTTLTGTSVVSSGDIQHRSVSLETIRSESVFDHVASGCVLTGTAYGSTRAWSLTAGVVYINGKRLTVSSATGTVGASSDTYFDLLDPGSGTVATLVNTGGNVVTQNAASPTLAASSVRIAIIQSISGSIASVASINQGQEDKLLPIASSVPYAVTDSLGNLICPRDPNRRILGLRIKTSTQGGITSVTDVTGMSSTFIVPGTGRLVKFSARGALESSVALDSMSLAIKIGATGYSKNEYSCHVANRTQSMVAFATTWLAGGTYTVKLTAERTAGTGTISLTADTGSNKCTLMVELV